MWVFLVRLAQKLPGIRPVVMVWVWCIDLLTVVCILGLSAARVLPTVLIGMCRPPGCMRLNPLLKLCRVVVLCLPILLRTGCIKLAVLEAFTVVCGTVVSSLVWDRPRLCRLTTCTTPLSTMFYCSNA